MCPFSPAYTFLFLMQPLKFEKSMYTDYAGLAISAEWAVLAGERYFSKKQTKAMMGIFGPNQNFFSLPVCSYDQYLKNGSKKLVLLP